MAAYRTCVPVMSCLAIATKVNPQTSIRTLKSGLRAIRLRAASELLHERQHSCRNLGRHICRAGAASHASREEGIRAFAEVAVADRVLALLDAACPLCLQWTVKVCTGEVRAMILSLALTLALHRKMDAIFDRAKRQPAAGGAVSVAAKRLQKIISLSFADRSLEALENLEHVFPDFAFF